MKKYKDLDLKKIREELDIDFAHFTYKPGMCSCCYGPTDLPKMYWRNKIVQSNKISFSPIEGNIVDDNHYTYLLFKNADNGSGHVKKEDYIDNSTCIEWGFEIEKLDKACRLLLEQLGEEYSILVPKTGHSCIQIISAEEKEYNNERYKLLTYKEL